MLLLGGEDNLFNFTPLMSYILKMSKGEETILK